MAVSRARGSLGELPLVLLAACMVDHTDETVISRRWDLWEGPDTGAARLCAVLDRTA